MVDVKKSGLKALKYLQDIDRDDILEAIGLEERRSGWESALGGLGIFALGCLVGVGLGMAFAPKSGAEFRNEIGERVRRKADELRPATENVTGANAYAGSTMPT